MIKSERGVNAQHWTHTLLARAQTLAERELARMQARIATKRHPWRHATQLWPHLFED